MLSISIIGPDRCAILEVPDPAICKNYVRVKVHSAPMCTEFKSFASGELCDCLGHEAAGEVMEVAQPGRVKVGDRVAVMPQFPCGRCRLCVEGDYIHCEDTERPEDVCGTATGRATFAQYLIKQDWLLLPLPDDMSYDHGAMACCGLGPSFGAMQKMRVGAGETVLITGLGPVGLGGVINGVYRNARVIGVDANPYRANLAMELGASHVISPADPEALAQIRALTRDGCGVDKAMDCTAISAAQKLAVDAVRRRGHITFVGWGGHLELGNMVPSGLTLQGSWHWNLRDSAKMMRTISDNASQLDRLMTHRFPMSGVQQAMELQTTGQCGKVILQPWA